VCIRGKIKHQAALDCGGAAYAGTFGAWRAPATSELRSPYPHHNYPYSNYLRQPLSLSPSLPLSLLPAQPPCTGAC